MSALEIKNLNFIYGAGTPFETAALKNVSVRFESGDFVGIIGHTGSGKSTLIQQLNGLLTPTSGSVFLGGKDIWANPKEIRNVRFKVGLVFQYPEYQLFEETVYKDIAFGPKNMGLSDKEVDERVREASAAVGLGEDILERSPFDLSGGQKRRAAIAGVMAMRPEVLILDEPTAGLDPMGRDKILSLIKEYHQSSGGTVLLVSHSMEDVAKYADKLLVMNRGEAAMYDTVGKVFVHSKQLEEMGLAVPAVTRVFDELKSRGVPVNDGIYTVEQALREIRRLKFGGDVNA